MGPETDGILPIVRLNVHGLNDICDRCTADASLRAPKLNRDGAGIMQHEDLNNVARLDGDAILDLYVGFVWFFFPVYVCCLVDAEAKPRPREIHSSLRIEGSQLFAQRPLQAPAKPRQMGGNVQQRKKETQNETTVPSSPLHPRCSTILAAARSTTDHPERRKVSGAVGGRWSGGPADLRAMELRMGGRMEGVQSGGPANRLQRRL